ncbi:hypothetical protein XENTR_v10012486 [Xenopus tropicalis]|uniref:Voltage-dependent T-type calcium channel subunit alpha-1I-like n=1 Tax=Xenopus tropicalis TaxID=8364 RepID=A0A8J0SM13_XENTR|nr:voltage-dependent T-type calcium channel subunit alpha-1I-like [Xenopus tropicalis]KAE8611511.1 hypothetical protein XENTR_v10012486 [Xenopus tropicalis]|eukprot:XP_012816930.1 PREDICTED: voltage-dependent T-type calcium channel subunit alpha-1I-like [Xenopus tropicalis]
MADSSAKNKVLKPSGTQEKFTARIQFHAKVSSHSMEESASGPPSPSVIWQPEAKSPGSRIQRMDAADLGVTDQHSPFSQDAPAAEEGGSQADLDVPYPDLAPVVFFCLKQTTTLRYWCIKVVCNPYPL